ncbi:MAG: hypothetical protein K6E32_04165 [Lachnospiraceae bacterium]|nr:hypothetical protein [Lachnospiraceae bacterium]
MAERSALPLTDRAAVFRERSTFFPEYLHSCLILAPWSAAFYTLFENRRDNLIIPLFFVSLFFVAPLSLLLRMAAMKAKSLWIYLGAGAVSLPLLALTYLTLNRIAPEGAIKYVGTFIHFVIFCFLFIDYFMLRTDENRRRKAYLENDRSFFAEDRPSKTPGIPGLVLYLLVYCDGLLFESPRTSDLGLWGCIAYLFVLIVYIYLRSGNEYLKENRELKRVPVRRIQKIGSLFLVSVCIGILFLCLIPLFTSGLRRYTNVRNWEVEGINLEKETKPEEIIEQHQPEAMPMPDLSELAEYEPNPVLDAIYRILTVILVVIVSVLCLVGAVLGIRGLFLHFKEDPGENGDIITSIDTEDSILKLKKERRRVYRDRSEKERIRRKYREIIRKATKEKPVISHTPTEIEAFAGLSDNDEMKAFHKVYEDARYGK